MCSWERRVVGALSQPQRRVWRWSLRPGICIPAEQNSAGSSVLGETPAACAAKQMGCRVLNQVQFLRSCLDNEHHSTQAYRSWIYGWILTRVFSFLQRCPWSCPCAPAVWVWSCHWPLVSELTLPLLLGFGAPWFRCLPGTAPARVWMWLTGLEPQSSRIAADPGSGVNSNHMLSW